MNLIEIEREYLLKKQKGQSFSEIRKELESEGLSEEQIKVVIRSIDNKIIISEVSKSNKNKGRQMIYMGVFLASIGLLITVGTYIGLINTGDYYILFYGPLIGGVGLIGVGINKN